MNADIRHADSVLVELGDVSTATRGSGGIELEGPIPFTGLG